MSKPLKPRRGTTAENNAFVGEAYEVTYDTNKNTLVCRDGLTAGGFPLAKEEEVSSLDSTLRALIAEEVAKCLKTSGGKLTGKLVGVSYEQLCPEIDQGVTPSENKYGSSIRLVDKHNVPVGQMIAIRKNSGDTVLRLTSFLPDGKNGAHLDIVTREGLQDLQLSGKGVLTSAGGNISGEFKFNVEEQNGINAVLANRNNGYVQFCGSSAWANGAVCTLHGKSYTTKPGWVELRATDGTNSASLVLKPDGSLLRTGSTILSVITWRSGATWYRKWSDGLIEQGGIVTASGTTAYVGFHIPFSNTDYFFKSDAFPYAQDASGGDGHSNRTTTGCTVFHTAWYHASPKRACWYACGY